MEKWDQHVIVMSTELSLSDCDALYEASNIDLIDNNAFINLGIYIDSSDKQIRRVVDEYKIKIEAGVSIENEVYNFANKPAIDLKLISKTIKRLENPESRIVDEIFCIWPEKYGDSDNDHCLNLIKNGLWKQAYQIWSENQGNYINNHNIAVLFLSIALAWTKHHLAEKYSEDRVLKTKEYWFHSLNTWRDVSSNSETWSYIRTRIEESQDSRVSTGYTRRLKDGLLPAIAMILADAAVRYQEVGQSQWFHFYVSLIQELKLPPELSKAALSKKYKKLKEKYDISIQNVIDDVKNHPKNTPSAVTKIISELDKKIPLCAGFFGNKSSELEFLCDDAVRKCRILINENYKEMGSNDAICTTLFNELQEYAKSEETKRTIAVAIQNYHRNQIYKILNNLDSENTSYDQQWNIVKTKVMPLFEEYIQLAVKNDDIDKVSDFIAGTCRDITIEAFNNNDVTLANSAYALAVQCAKNNSLKDRLKTDYKILNNAF
jgi:hypothetical protein